MKGVDRPVSADLVGADVGEAALKDSPSSIFLQAEPGKCNIEHLSPKWMATKPSLSVWRRALHLHQHISKSNLLKMKISQLPELQTQMLFN